MEGDASGDYGQNDTDKTICKANDSDDIEVIFGETTVTGELVIREGAAQATQAKQAL